MIKLTILLHFVAFPAIFATDAEIEKFDKEFYPPEPDSTREVEVICNAAHAPDPDKKVNISGELSYEDLLRLVVWSHKYKITHGYKFRNMSSEVSWKRNVLLKLGDVYNVTCPDVHIHSTFIYRTLELFMIYMNSVENPQDNSDKWNKSEVLVVLKDCWEEFHDDEPEKQAEKQLQLISSGYDVTGFTWKVNETYTVNVTENLVTKEAADQRRSDIDPIVDTVWWLFSLSIGRCYRFAKVPLFWAARFKRMFYADFLSPVKNRWLHSGQTVDFGVLFGEEEYRRTIENLRGCVAAAYINNKIADKQLVRTLWLADPADGIDAGLNNKRAPY